VIGCLYLPNGNPQPGPKFDYKLAWFERLIAYAAALLESGHPVILTGDFNVVPTDEDIYNPRSWKKMRCCNRRPANVSSASLRRESRGPRSSTTPMKPSTTS
jgi:exonuclease III